jgi:U3 small nucleolar RNA-associated protein 22
VSLDGIQLRKEDPVDILDRGSYLSSTFASMDRILRQALGSRATAVAILCPGNSSRPVTQGQPNPITAVEIGLLLDPENAFRLIDRGPKVDDNAQSIAIFRDFWGEKAELRRFADGSIVECVAWEVERPHQRAYIPSQIVRHILGRHFNLKKVKDVHSTYDEFIHPSIPRPGISTGKDGGYKVVMQAFDALVKQIKAMELPLSLVACLPCAEALRYTSILLPSPTPLSRIATLPDCAKYVAVYDAVLQFEKSARWPDDLGAIQKLKLAWFEKVAKDLMEKLPGSMACVAMDVLASPIEDSASLEVGLASGFAFRLRIYHDRERTLLERTIGDKSALPFQKADAEKSLAVHMGRFVHAPRHHAAIMNMHHRHVGYSPTVRLVKRWFSSHLLSNSILTELVELVCAYVFLQADPQLVPHTGPDGFARVIAFLSQWQWRTEPLLIPILSMAGLAESSIVQFPTDVQQTAEDNFKGRRAVDPGMSSGAWHLATEQDIEGVFWCLGGRGPTPMVAERVKILAKASWQCIEKGHEDEATVKVCFH